jgi:NADH-quinone oxidoreductase subunit N
LREARNELRCALSAPRCLKRRSKSPRCWCSSSISDSCAKPLSNSHSSRCVIGIAGCIAAVWAVYAAGWAGFSAGSDLLLAAGGSAGVAQVAILVLTAVTLLQVVDSGSTESSFTRNAGEYVSVVLMAAAGGLIISAAQDLLVIFVGLELLSLGLYILTAFNKQSGKSAEAAIKYYLFGAMSAAFLLFGFSYLYGLSGSTSLPEIVLGTYLASARGGTPLLLIALVMIAAGLGFKIAAFPFHLWAPDTYEGAPAPAAAFIASVSKVASFALLISISYAILWWPAMLHLKGGGVTFTASPAGTPQPPATVGFVPTWPMILMDLSVLSMIFGNLAALAQSSVRRLLAYSAIAHAGYILLGLAFFSWTNVSAQAILYYSVTYGLTTIGAFGVVGVVERATGSDKLDAFLGLHKRNPLLAAFCLCSSSRSPEFRHSSASGPSSICLRLCFAFRAAHFRSRWSLSPSHSAPSRSTTICRSSSALTSCPRPTNRPSARIPSRWAC